MTIWEKEWREFVGRRTGGPLRVLLPTAVAAPLLLGPPNLSLPAFAVLITVVAWWGPGAKFARERSSGLLQRLALTPIRPGSLVLRKLLARTVLAWLQLLPAAALTAAGGNIIPASSGLALPEWDAAAPLTLLSFAAVAATGGCLTGLLVRSRPRALLAGALATAGAGVLGWTGARSGWTADPIWAAAAGAMALLLSFAAARLSSAVLFSHE